MVLTVMGAVVLMQMLERRVDVKLLESGDVRKVTVDFATLGSVGTIIPKESLTDAVLVLQTVTLHLSERVAKIHCEFQSL